jgi:hypothetical protein
MLHLSQRIPLVCNVLRSEKFLRANNLELENIEGPPSKQGPNVVFTYRLKEGGASPAQTALSAFDSIYGIGKDVFAALGGGEAFLRREREEFYTPENGS